MNMDFTHKLAIPMEVKEMYPVSAETAQTIDAGRIELKNILAGKNDKFVLIIGPCSADSEEPVLDYISRLAKVAEKVKDKIFIVPRIYTNKPRTTGLGYKGLLHQPNPNEAPDMFKGIIATRELHMRAVEETGFICADEMLYPENYKYLDDILGYAAVGARSVEDQQHRLTASAMEVPVGMKNPTSGDLSVMMNAIYAAQQKHTFLYRGWEGHSYGNPYAHAIMRGYSNEYGTTFPNYHYENIKRVQEYYEKMDLQNPAIVIDTNHANSGKNPFEQPRIVHEILDYRRHHEDLVKLIKGLMIESYIEDGSQKVGEGTYGKSITDACLGWQKSERLIYEIAEML